MAAQRLGSARLHRAQRRMRAGHHAVADLGALGWALWAEDVAEPGQGMPAGSWSSPSVACTAAVRVRWVELAVGVGEGWPSQRWIKPRLTPRSRTGVAQAWRQRCTRAGVFSLTGCTARWKAFCSPRACIGVVGGPALTATLSGTWKAPDRVALGARVGAQPGQGPRRERDGAIRRAFPSAKVSLQAGPGNLGPLQAHAVQPPPPAGVDDAQADPVVREANLAKQEPNLRHAQHHGPFLRPGRTDERSERPGAREGGGRAEFDGMEGQGGGIGRDVFDVDAGAELRAEFLRGDPVRRFARVDRQVLDRRKGGLRRARCQPAQRHGRAHPLTERGHFAPPIDTPRVNRRNRYTSGPA